MCCTILAIVKLLIGQKYFKRCFKKILKDLKYSKKIPQRFKLEENQFKSI